MTIRELTNEVARTGMLDVSEEKVLEYQDMIGHASLEENKDLLNSTLMESFLRIYGVAYGTNAAIRYYLQNSEAQLDRERKINALTEDVETFRKKIMELEKENIDWRNLQEENVKIIGKLERERDEWEQNYHVLEDEVIRLKAKLYDLLDRQGR